VKEDAPAIIFSECWQDQPPLESSSGFDAHDAFHADFSDVSTVGVAELCEVGVGSGHWCVWFVVAVAVSGDGERIAGMLRLRNSKVAF
jgi:hypothetical protein